MSTRRGTTPTVAVAVHDGYYGCGTGAGYANLAFLEALVETLPPTVRLAVLPVWLSPRSRERHSQWYQQVRELLGHAEVYPVDNGTGGADRWGRLANFRHLVADTAATLRREVLPTAGPLLVVAFDAPFFGLPALLPEARGHTVLVPHSTGLIHAPHDLDRVAWERAGLRSGARIGVISEYLRGHLRDDYGVPPESFVQLPVGLSNSDWHRFSRPAPEPSRGEFILAMGRAQPYKGFDDLIDAVARCRDTGRTLPQLVLAATGEAAAPTRYQRALVERIRRLDLDVTFLSSFRAEVATLLTHPDLRGVVVPSRVEPFGRIPMEAFAAGAVPVITTTAGGLAEQLDDGRTGLTCPPGAPNALADALATATALTPEARQRMRIRARQAVLRERNHPAEVRRFLAETAPWLRLSDPDDQLRLLSSPPPPTRSAVTTVPPVKVPIGPQSAHWNTITPRRLVLVVAHHVTSLLRLLDVLTVFDADPRIQVVFSQNGSDPFQHGLSRFLDELDVIVIPWSQAVDTRFDLAIAANHGGLTEIAAPVVILPHGVGYNKYSPGNRKSEIGNRKSEIGTESRSVFGLAPEWLLYDGRPVAASLVLSHDEQLARLAAATPTAVETAVVAGDPCYDRMLRSEHLRARYRDAFRLGDRSLVTVSTTWSPRSLLGSWPSLFRELLACLPIDEYRVAALVHPNIWHGHGPWQLHTWLADCVRAGLLLIPPAEGWQAALLAADLVVGDHGATTCYGAALRRPVLLATFPDEDVAPGSAADVLGSTAPRLNRREPLLAQVEQALGAPADDQVRALVTSCPGESADRLRRLLYGHLDLPAPAGEPPVPVISPDDVYVSNRSEVRADHVVCVLDGTGGATVTRYPADVQTDLANAGHLDAAHLVVHEDHARRALLDRAAIIAVASSDPAALTEALRRHPGAAMAVTARAPRACLIRTREGLVLELPADDHLAAASLLYTWQLAGRDPRALPATTIVAGAREISVA